MNFTLYVDDVGNIVWNDQNQYGLGFVFLPSDQVSTAEKLLEENGLGKIHLLDLSISEKIELSKKIGSLDFDSLQTLGGAIFQSNPDFAGSAINDQIVDSFNKSPEFAMNVIRSNKALKESKKTILLPNEILSPIYNTSRLLEIGILIARYPLLRIFQMHASEADIHVNIKISVSGTKSDYDKKMELAHLNIDGVIQRFLINARIKGILKSKSRVRFTMETVADSSGLFGLADFF